MDTWVEVQGKDPREAESRAAAVLPVLSALLESEGHRSQVGEELASRYEEIDLLYTITEILGSTVRLDEAAQVIVGEVAAVVGARRASIMVHDAVRGRLRTVAARGFTADDEYFVDVNDPESVAARVFRERRVVVHDPSTSAPRPAGTGNSRPYRGEAFLSVPICYATQGSPTRCIGVINLTDRNGGDRFTPGDRKLLTAIASQVGAAIENVRLAERDRQQQRVRREPNWRTTCSSASSRHPMCCTVRRRSPRDAFPWSRWAATSTPSAALGMGGWRSCWAMSRPTALAPRW